MDVNSAIAIAFAQGKKSGSGFYSTKENAAGGLTYAFKAKESEGGGAMEGFHMVRFFNDDRTTLLYTVFVPTGANAMYAGETPVSTIDGAYVFGGFEPSPANVTADMDCYAVYGHFDSLEEATWEQIAQVSTDGTAQNYFAVGDTKMIHIEGTVGAHEINSELGVYIIGFDHNEEIEGKGIHFGTFKNGGVELALHSGRSGNSDDTNGDKYFNLNHWGGLNYGGWAACDLRYDILGSTDVAPSNYGEARTTASVGYDASETCATNPVHNTIMAALPAELRAVMKPMVKYTDNFGGKTNTEDTVTVKIDYLPLLSEFEVFGKITNANSYESNKQKQYEYYAIGRSEKKYRHSAIATATGWWTRSVKIGDTYGFVQVNTGGASTYTASYFSAGLAPIFKV